MKAIVSVHGSENPNLIQVALCKEFSLEYHGQGVGTRLELEGPGFNLCHPMSEGFKGYPVKLTPQEISTYYFTRWIWVMEM